MGRQSSGNVYKSRGRLFIRVRVSAKHRPSAMLVTLDDREARDRATLANKLVNELRDAGKLEYLDRVLEQCAAARVSDLPKLSKLVAGICAGTERPQRELPTSPTFKSVRERWTSEELAEDFPDHVKRKRTAHDDELLAARYIEPIEIEPGITFGDLPIGTVRLDHCERVMSKLPTHLAPTSRRHVAQVLSRVLALAVYPLRHIAASPLPKGFLPPVRERKAKGYLFPEEEAKLLACTALDDNGNALVPLEYRVLYGFLSREGMRKGEALSLAWSSLDVERGLVRLDENKSDDPRAWSLSPDVARALKRWKEIAPPRALVFAVPEEGKHLADALRTHLRAAGVDRAELFERTKTRMRVRVHDLRATFVTVNLANGKSETWIADRTGHRSSEMINRYRRASRTFAELRLGQLAPLDVAIPELRSTVPMGGNSGGRRRSVYRAHIRRQPQNPMISSGEKGIRTPGTLAGTPDFESGTFGHSDISPPRKLIDRWGRCQARLPDFSGPSSLLAFRPRRPCRKPARACTHRSSGPCSCRCSGRGAPSRGRRTSTRLWARGA